MTFFFQGPNRIFPICTYVHAHPHTHSLIDTLTDHTHSHVTHTHHAHTHIIKYSLLPCIVTQTLHTHTHTPGTHHTHMHSHRHTQQATTDTYHTHSTSKYLSTQPGIEVIPVNKTDQISFPPGACIKSKEKTEENMSLELEDKE